MVKPIAVGSVVTLALDGQDVPEICFKLGGPFGNGKKSLSSNRLIGKHDGFIRKHLGLDPKRLTLMAHDRQWTAVSAEEIDAVLGKIDGERQSGMFRENLVFEGIPDFSAIPKGCFLVFPELDGQQLALEVCDENSPCKGMRDYAMERLSRDVYWGKKLVAGMQGSRGLMGRVYMPGIVRSGDEVKLMPPPRRKWRE